jgi:hypothetical protein
MRATSQPEERVSGSNFLLIRNRDQRSNVSCQPSHDAQTVISWSGAHARLVRSRKLEGDTI